MEKVHWKTFFRISEPAGSGKPGASILGESLGQEEPKDTSSMRIGLAVSPAHLWPYSYFNQIRDLVCRRAIQAVSFYSLHVQDFASIYSWLGMYIKHFSHTHFFKWVNNFTSLSAYKYSYNITILRKQFKALTMIYSFEPPSKWRLSVSDIRLGLQTKKSCQILLLCCLLFRLVFYHFKICIVIFGQKAGSFCQSYSFLQ